MSKFGVAWNKHHKGMGMVKGGDRDSLHITTRKWVW